MLGKINTGYTMFRCRQNVCLTNFHVQIALDCPRKLCIIYMSCHLQSYM